MTTFGERLRAVVKRADAREKRISFYQTLLAIPDSDLDPTGVPKWSAFLYQADLDEKRIVEDHFRPSAYPELGVVGPTPMHRLIREAKYWTAEAFADGWDIQTQTLTSEPTRGLRSLIRVAAQWAQTHPKLARLEPAQVPIPFQRNIDAILGHTYSPQMLASIAESDLDAVPEVVRRARGILADGVAQIVRDPKNISVGEVQARSRSALRHLGLDRAREDEEHALITAIARVVVGQDRSPLVRSHLQRAYLALNVIEKDANA